MTLDEALVEWKSKDRSRLGVSRLPTGSVAVTKEFMPTVLTRASGSTLWEHVKVTDGHVLLDPSPWKDAPEAGPLLRRSS